MLSNATFQLILNLICTQKPTACDHTRMSGKENLLTGRNPEQGQANVEEQRNRHICHKCIRHMELLLVSLKMDLKLRGVSVK